MRRWLDDDVIAQGRLPLLCFLLGFILGFLVIRVSVRLIRAQVRWWPGNLRAGDTHIHHMVFGVILVLTSGIGMISTFDDGSSATGALLAALFGVGAALVLDEFALIYYLRDVYWEEQGRTSVDAVFVALAVTGLLLLGFHPLWLLDINDFRHDPSVAARALVVLFAVVNLILAAIVIAKGKIWTGLFGMFFLPLLVVGALRLSRPGAPWARWRYGDRRRLMYRAIVRERRYRRPVIRAKIFVQDLVAGKPDVEHVRSAAEAELQRTVVPAPPAPHRHHAPWSHEHDTPR
ncbi:hypothetical protein IU510_27830 [Nocardia cyriacigeorgica]|uniref:hypothetical protein n=1 Tax=Nocardia cyriacigeorgica TaxID=135487 RepID=UPI001895BEBA|nr:hypothetical protein [Nocardia cyriacigeorgica]MBF6101834.1 hypothetical protein [Nocardia cyriacigeorgica]MBF6158687.1 hypothetical protein [Nocardia cyriacigeorgica]MBF6197626.1 hypothetical protein [Nocardia cyriacigeorgica]MBF6316491.1 hypothetical protein [Nocardia cyriacigeorgica]MBF6344973.1 hypothetical protein [Nocardia cyriacigeorgica]